MGYISEVRGSLVASPLGVEIKHPSSSFAAEAKELGIAVPEQVFVHNATKFRTAEDLNSFLREGLREDYELHWIEDIESVGDDYVIQLHNSGKAYELKENISAIVNLLDENAWIVNGVVTERGEDWDDISRIVVKDNVVTKEKAVVTAVFPDGTKFED